MIPNDTVELWALFLRADPPVEFGHGLIQVKKTHPVHWTLESMYSSFDAATLAEIQFRDDGYQTVIQKVTFQRPKDLLQSLHDAMKEHDSDER